MAAEKKGQTIIIKKIYNAAGGHGGGWKVALADFMTAMMAFFLVMWLLGQSTESKQAVSDYFSTPSVIEYNFQNFGVVMTLEKLFLDLLNEPLTAVQSFVEPMDKTPNLLDMGSASVVAAYMADQLNDVLASGDQVKISTDGFTFSIQDDLLFEPGTAQPTKDFVKVMEKIQKMTNGVKEANVVVTAQLFTQSVPSQKTEEARLIAEERAVIIERRVESSMESPTNSVVAQYQVKDKDNYIPGEPVVGFIQFSIKQKEIKSDGTKPRPLSEVFGKKDSSMNVYDNFVKQVSEQKPAPKK